MAFLSKKGTVKWNIPKSKSELQSSSSKRAVTGQNDSMSEKYVYSDDFEDQTLQLTYSDTFVSDSYSDSFMNGSSHTADGSDKNTSTDIRTAISLKTTVDGSEIQEATNLETARTEMLETVIEVESDHSYTTDLSTTLKTAHDTTRDISRDRVDTHTSDSHVYSDTFESSERTKAESHYDESRTSPSDRSTYTESYSSKTYSDYSQEDESLLDRSYIAPDYDGKSLTDDENDYDDDTYDEDYSYTFEPTEPSTYLHQDPEQTRIEAEQINIAEQAKKDFVKTMLGKLKSKPEKKFKQLETLPTTAEDAEDDYLKHYCKKKIKLLKKKKHANQNLDDSDEVTESSEKSTSLQHELLCDYGLPDSVLERAKINNILSAMKRAAKEEIHEPAKCPDCRMVKSKLDAEDDERKFVSAHAKRLKSKLMDAKVEEHLLKMNSISMIAELARDLPRASEKPEKIFDQLFEPLLGKNVMR